MTQLWFVGGLENDQLNVTEISILDQYVTDMISFSQGALSEIKNQKKQNTNNICVEDVISSLIEPVKLVNNNQIVVVAPKDEVIDNDNDNNNDEEIQNSKCESIIIEDKTPSEEEIQQGTVDGNVYKGTKKLIVIARA